MNILYFLQDSIFFRNNQKIPTKNRQILHFQNKFDTFALAIMHNRVARMVE